MSMNVWNWCRSTCEIDVDWSKNQLMSIDVSIDVNERVKLMSMNVRNRCRLIKKSVEINRRVDWVFYWRKNQNTFAYLKKQYKNIKSRKRLNDWNSYRQKKNATWLFVTIFIWQHLHTWYHSFDITCFNIDHRFVDSDDSQTRIFSHSKV